MIVSKTIRIIMNTAIPPIVADIIIIVSPPGIVSGILVDLVMTDEVGLDAIVEGAVHEQKYLITIIIGLGLFEFD